MSFIREVKDILKFYIKTKPEEKEIVIYSEHEGYYPYFEGIVKELTEKNNKNICYITSDINDPILTGGQKGIIPFYSKILLPFFMNMLNSKICLMTVTDLNHIYLSTNLD